MEKINKVSFASIVLNEEKYIERMLESVVGKVDEIVVVDGGSTDNTLRILKDYPQVKVVSKVFNYHFGDQRNFAIQQTKYPWVLMLDADEYIEEDFWKILPDLINQKEYDAFKFKRKNFIDEVFDEKSYPDIQVRLFRRYCRWIYPVHEELVGWKSSKILETHIIHKKDSVRYQQRNKMFSTIGQIFKNDLPEMLVQSKNVSSI